MKCPVDEMIQDAAQGRCFRIALRIAADLSDSDPVKRLIAAEMLLVLAEGFAPSLRRKLAYHLTVLRHAVGEGEASHLLDDLIQKFSAIRVSVPVSIVPSSN